MLGMSATTGKALSGSEHRAQRIRDILTTPLGSRVMRRDYGSLLFQLIDAPLNPATLVKIFGAVALALKRWEPDWILARASLALDGAGKTSITLAGRDRNAPPGETNTTLSIPLS